MSPYSQMSPRRRAIYTFVIPSGLLLTMLTITIVLIVVAGNAREEDRMVSRYVLCRETDKIKAALRVDLTKKINDTVDFLIRNPDGIAGIPELNGAVLRDAMARNIQLRKELAPYPRGCAAFARDPSDLNVHVPEPKETP